MTIGLRPALLALAVVLFLIAALGDADADLIAWGLAALAAGLLVGELRLRRR
jgi:hypothetical protein